VSTDSSDFSANDFCLNCRDISRTYAVLHLVTATRHWYKSGVLLLLLLLLLLLQNLYSAQIQASSSQRRWCG